VRRAISGTNKVDVDHGALRRGWWAHTERPWSRGHGEQRQVLAARGARPTSELRRAEHYKSLITTYDGNPLIGRRGAVRHVRGPGQASHRLGISAGPETQFQVHRRASEGVEGLAAADAAKKLADAAVDAAKKLTDATKEAEETVTAARGSSTVAPEEAQVPIESGEERAAREDDEMAALNAVGDYEADPNVMLEDVPQDIVFKNLKVSCACVAVLVFACVRVCASAPSICVRENLYLHFLNFVCVCVCATGKAHRTQVREWMGGWSDQGL
jgi:hypothetical protein